MVEENKKTLLIVEDDRDLLGMYKLSLGGDYNITPIFYEGVRTEIPKRRFDIAFLDGLHGDCINVMGRINAKKKFIVSGNCDIVKMATNENLKAVMKPVNLNKLGDILRE